MSKQADIIRELQDRLNAAEATALNTHKRLLNVEKLKPKRNNIETTSARLRLTSEIWLRLTSGLLCS